MQKLTKKKVKLFMNMLKKIIVMIISINVLFFMKKMLLGVYFPLLFLMKIVLYIGLQVVIYGLEYTYNNPNRIISKMYSISFNNKNIAGSYLNATLTCPENKSSGYYYCNIGDASSRPAVFTTKDIPNLSKLLLNKHSDTQIPRSGLYFGESIDKLNLYELNLTDMDYDNQEHLFNICTYTDSPYYDEIMDCYNRDLPYTIFVDDYTRTLTYGEENNDSSFMYGSYMLSGYIDYLIDDNAFFYYDNLTKSVEICHGKFGNSETYRTSILENSGDFSKSRKRFYFKLVYSEDSNDPDQVIWSDNGNLTLTKTNNDDAPPICFVGSSHNIPYTHYEKRNPIDVLWNTRRLVIDNSYYYVGYMGSGVHRDITSVPFYHYDFYFYGGTTKLFFANSSTFKEDKKKRYEELADDYSKDGRQKDSSDGGSGIKGKGSSSSTYDRDQITDDSTQDDLDDNSDGYRGTEKTDRDGENDEEDRTGFHFLSTLNKIKDKFNFVGNITKNANDIKDFVENTQETHKYYVNINHKYLNGTVCIIDLSWYAPYKETVDAFICAFAYLAFIWHMFCKIPDLIHGASAATYVSDISSYMNKK